MTPCFRFLVKKCNDQCVTQEDMSIYTNCHGSCTQIGMKKRRKKSRVTAASVYWYSNSNSSSPSISKMTRQCWCLRIWAWSPKVEAQILPQSWQGTAVLGFGTLFFLADLLSSRLCSRLFSKCFVPSRIAALQAGWSWAKACHSSTGML